MKTGLKKNQKTTEILFDEGSPIIRIYTHNTDLKNRLTVYAKRFPNLCKLTDEDAEFIDTIGYVANSVNTVFDGTYSAGRLYDHFDDHAYAQVMFITHSSVIALFIPKEEVEKDGEPVVEADGAERTQVSPKMKIGF